jgi:hypothetical protein
MISTPINSVDALDRVLGPSFVILAGSAISATNAPWLPSVDGFRLELLRAIQTHAGIATYRERLGCRYARKLSAGRYAALRKGTKFEQFLEDLVRVTSRPAVNDLLADTFTCVKGQYGPNHAAIAELSRSGGCEACLTTNFDNAIERAMATSTTPNVIVGAPTSGVSQAGTIYKLHGRAEDRSCDFTASDLLTKARSGFYDWLETLLRGKVVLVVGYSGRGDIDIAGHLRRADAHYVWGYVDPKEPLPWDGFAGHRMWLDLSAAAPRSANLLVALAAKRGDAARLSPPVAIPHEWKTHLDDWAEKHCPSVADFVSEIFGWRMPIPALHMHYADDKTRPGFALHAASLLNASGSYGSALSVCLRHLDRAGLSREDQVSFMRYVGFALWRLWLRRWSRRVLHETLRVALQHVQGRLLADTCRHYLEVCRDILQDIQDANRRRALAERWQLDTAIDGLQRSHSESPENDILSRLIVREIKDLTGESIPIGDFLDLFEEASASSYDRTAWAAASALAFRDARRGVHRLRQVQRRLRGTALHHFVWKCRLSRCEARVCHWCRVTRRPILALVRAAFGRGVLGSVIRSALRDVSLSARRIIWALAPGRLSSHGRP